MDVKILNISQTFAYTSIKEANKDFTAAICSAEITNAPPEISNSIRRVLKNEKPGFRFDLSQDNIKTSSLQLNIVEVYTNIIMCPVRYDLTNEDLQIEMYIDYTNETDDIIAVTFGDFKYKDYKPSYPITYSTIELVYLEPGNRLQISGIKIIEGKDHAAFCDVVACTSYPLDRIWNVPCADGNSIFDYLKAWKDTGIKMVDKIFRSLYVFNDRTSKSSPMHHKLIFEVPTARPGQKHITERMILLACDIILRRLDNMIHVVKNDVVEIDRSFTHISFVMLETNTIAKLLERMMVVYIPTLKNIESVITYPDNMFSFYLYADNAEAEYMKVVEETKKIYLKLRNQILKK